MNMNELNMNENLMKINMQLCFYSVSSMSQLKICNSFSTPPRVSFNVIS